MKPLTKLHRGKVEGEKNDKWECGDVSFRGEREEEWGDMKLGGSK